MIVEFKLRQIAHLSAPDFEHAWRVARVLYFMDTISVLISRVVMFVEKMS